MYKLILVVCVFVFWSLWFSFAHILDLEADFLSPDTDMYLSNFYPDLVKEVESSCSSQDIDLAKILYNKAKPKVQSKYSGQQDFRKLQITRELHDKYLAKNMSISSENQLEYCVLKYILYNVLDDLRDQHLSLMEQYWLMKDFEWFATSGPISWFELKKQQLQSEVTDMRRYISLLWTTINFEDLNKNDIATTGEYSVIKELSSELLQLTVYKVLYNMKERNVIQQKDINELKNKIKLEYHLSCGSFHGNYRIKETLDHKWNHVSYSTVGLPLQINVCGNYFLLWTLAHHYEKIVTHELWHHVYYYNDQSSDSFIDMCRDESIFICDSQAFITPYASTHPYEDYAESFMYRFMDLPTSSDGMILNKLWHFDNVFGE